MVKKIVLWILTVLWAATIFSFSAQPATQSDEISEGFTKKIVRAIDVTNSLTEEDVETIAENLNHFVRKTAHFFAYALLAVLLFLLFREYGFNLFHTMILAVAIAGLYACSDEFHQTFVPGRSGEIRDVGIDTTGALFGVLVIWTISFIVNKVKKRKNQDERICTLKV